MAHFIPANQAQADALAQRLQGSLFQTVENFVQYYNSGLINRKFDDVQAILAEVTSAYKDVKEKGGRLTFISEQEVVLAEVMAALAPWDTIAKVKREVTDALRDGTLGTDDYLVIGENGALSRYSQEENTLTPLTNERMFTKNDDITKLLSFSSLGNQVNEQVEGYLFAPADITGVDDGFITQLRNIVPRD